MKYIVIALVAALGGVGFLACPPEEGKAERIKEIEAKIDSLAEDVTTLEAELEALKTSFETHMEEHHKPTPRPPAPKPEKPEPPLKMPKPIRG